MEWMLLPLKRYAQFSGRARRKEFWMFMLFGFLVFVVTMILDSLFGFGTTRRHAEVGDGGIAAGFDSSGGLITTVAILALFLPSLAVEVRRLHDTDRSGWWLLLSLVPLVGTIVLLVFLCLDGSSGPNRFGADPKGEAPADPV